MYTPRNPNIPLTFEERLAREVERRWQQQIEGEIDATRSRNRRLKNLTLYGINLYRESLELDAALWRIEIQMDDCVRRALTVFAIAPRLTWLQLVADEAAEAEGQDCYCDNCGGRLDDGGIHFLQTAPDCWICQPNVAEARADATEDDWKVR